MENKKFDPILMISAAAALIATAYVLYMTVFEQIISQNQGYFYAVVFGFILLVLFLLCNLFTKLIAISAGEQHTPYRKLIVVISLVVLAVLFLVVRMKYSTQLYAGDSYVYRGAVGLVDGTYSQSRDVVDDALANPSHFLYSFMLSLIFRFAEPGSTPILWANAFFIVLCGFLTYRIVRKFTNQMCGIFAAALSVIIPSQTFAVYSFTSEPMVSAIYLGAVLSLISLFSYNKRVREMYDAGEYSEDRKDYAGTVYTAFGALTIGLLIFVEPFMIIPMALMVLVGYFTHKSKALSMLLAFACGIVIMVLLCFVKSSFLQVDFGTVMTSEMSAFDPKMNHNTGQESEFSDVFHSYNVDLSSTNGNITENYIFLSDSTGAGAYTEMSASWVVVLNQIMYMFVLMMSISCIILAIKEQKDYVVVISILIVGSVVMLLFQQNRSNQKFLFVSVFIIATATGLHYLYLDHHPELKVGINALDALEKTGRKEIAAATRSNLKNAAQMSEADFVKRAKALIFVGNDEDLYHRIKAEEHRKAEGYTGKKAVVEDSFDDYDDDFFLDNEDNVDDSEVRVTTVAPSGIRETVGDAYVPNAEMHESASEAFNNSSVPAWKRPEKFGDDEMFDEDDVELGVAHSSFEGRDSIVASAPITTDEPAPEVEKISRNKKKVSVDVTPKKTDAVKPEKVKKEKVKAEKVKPEKVKKEKKAAEKPAKTYSSEPATSTMSGGKAIRRVKNVGTGAAAQTVSVSRTSVKPAEVKPSEPIPNPLPVPKKKDHKPIDYDREVKKSDDDWDFDYDVGSEDDDWDI